MHTEMWEHPATLANVATLRERGVQVIDPASGRLTGADTGPGRLPEPEQLFAAVPGRARPRAAPTARRATWPGAPWSSAPAAPASRWTRCATSATAPPGKQGVALARAAAARGAKVTLVAANIVADGTRRASTRVPVDTRARAARRRAGPRRDADAVVMAAAVADFRPATYAEHKIKKTDDPTADAPTIELVRNPDVLAELVAAPAQRAGAGARRLRRRDRRRDGDVLDHGRAKLARKGCDLIVVNEVGVEHDLRPGRQHGAPPAPGVRRPSPTWARPPSSRSRTPSGTPSCPSSDGSAPTSRSTSHDSLMLRRFVSVSRDLDEFRDGEGPHHDSW